MEKSNKKALYELMLLNSAFKEELEAASVNDRAYSRYHFQNAEWYRALASQFNQALNYTGQTEDDLISHMATLELSTEQKHELQKARREPMFKKLMGETALKQKSELEVLLGTSITDEGISLASQSGVTATIKSEDTLDKELNSHNEKLDSLLQAGAITEEQYENASQTLDYIYDYYYSKSKGQQISFRKLDDNQYRNIEKEAEENDISFNEQLKNITQGIISNFEETQKTADTIENKTK